eukprot:TRINITY_DN3773_c0_g1_i2.p2 TRINITY_DN3773_c0_g1~~TRINITY_DN3773_c0_g1_i2.p2  ORF type:complete len:66 (-),score=5.67 TRINITY_DN3773_c0_g1_i2:2-199(-)
MKVQQILVVTNFGLFRSAVMLQSFSELRVKNKKDRTDSTRWTTVFPSYSVVDTGRSSETAKAHRG